MIKIKNLTKIYNNKNEKIFALNDISFETKNCGFLSIVGESGCGKTTLLNLIGGLDKETSGDIFVNNININEYSSLDCFRNESVAYIFQDFNLIEELNVEENLKLVLSLQEQENIQQIDNVLKKVGLENFNKRKINQLSKGQKQRVAIGRAIIKNSHFILADEPTGNLDSENSVEIFSLLKEIAKEKLVVIVSHNKELCEKFCSRMITMSDGKIIDDKIFDVVSNKKNIKSKSVKCKLKNKVVFNLAYSNIKRHIGKSFISVLLFVLTLLCLTFGQYFTMFNSEKVIAKELDRSSMFALSQSIYADNKKIQEMKFETNCEINDGIYFHELCGLPYVKGYNIDFSNTEKYYENSFYLIDNIDTLNLLGIQFYNKIDLSDDGVYLTDYLIEYMLNNSFILKNETDAKNYSNLVGNSILEFNYFEEKYEEKYKIDGVIKTNYKEYFNDDFSIKKNNGNLFTDDSVYAEYVNKLKNERFIPIYLTKTFLENNSDLSRINLMNDSNKQILYNNAQKIDDIAVLNNQMYDMQVVIDGKFCNSNEVELSENEVFLNLSLYNNLTNNPISYNDLLKFIKFNEYGERVCNYKFDLLGKLNLQLNQKHRNAILLNMQNKVIKGIVVKNAMLEQNDVLEIYCNQNVIKDNIILNNINNLCFVKTQLNTNIKKFADDLRMNYNIGFNDVISNYVYNFESNKNSMSFVFIGFSILFIVIAFLVSINVISFSINDRKRNIGTLKALGTRNMDINKIFICESVIISSMIFLFGIIVAFLSSYILNSIMSFGIANAIHFFNVSYVTIFICFSMSILLNLFATLIPLVKLKRKTPIDLLNNN